MSKLRESFYHGVHRVRADVIGPAGRARVERVSDNDPTRERYTVRFYASATPSAPGQLIGTCWRYVASAPVAPDHYDGGWIRALALAEDCTQGSAEEAYRA